MNLRECNGMVPIRTDDIERPWKLIPFPGKEEFSAMFKSRRGPSVNIDRYWEVLTTRASGANLTETAKQFGITKERVRQMEAKFLRQVELSSRID